MALILADARRASAVAAAAGAKEKRLLNLDYVTNAYWGGVITAATYENKRMVYFINGVYDTGATSRGGTIGFRYESPAVAEAVYNWMIAMCAASTGATIALDMAQDTSIISVNPLTGAAGVPVEIVSNGRFINGGKVTLNSVSGAEQVDCTTRFGSSSSVSFNVPAGLTAARVYDVVWSHPNGRYAFKLAAFTAS